MRAPDSTSVLALGTPVPSGLPLGFATAWVTPDVIVTSTTQLHGNPFGGALGYTVRVPNAPGAIGFPLSFQWGVFDATAAQGFSHSAAVTAHLQ